MGEVSVRLEVQNTATRGLAATAAYTNTDSVRYTRIFTTSGNVDITFKNNCIAKYKFGDGILSPAFTATNPLVLMFSKKSSPFNNPYTSINTSFFFQNTIQPLYTSGDDAYIAFRTTATPNIPSPIYYFGWIHVIVYQNQITFDKAAYRLGSFLDAGKLDD